MNDRSDRRQFFRKLVGHALEQAAELLDDPRHGSDVGSTDGSAAPDSGESLRPPGALPEAGFLDTCQRCHACVDACPARAIHPTENGSPAIVAGVQPCLVCDGLSCMSVCPSGALRPVAREAIRMGRVVIDHPQCLRSGGEDCRVCVDLCPLGEAALRLDDTGAVTVGAGCIGCGICEWKCPTWPRAVAVEPVGGAACPP